MVNAPAVGTGVVADVAVVDVVGALEGVDAVLVLFFEPPQAVTASTRMVELIASTAGLCIASFPLSVATGRFDLDEKDAPFRQYLPGRSALVPQRRLQTVGTRRVPNANHRALGTESRARQAARRSSVAAARPAPESRHV
jgi:hypothetical protein